MSCTTILVGKKASNDASTMIARTDDGRFDVKRIDVLDPAKAERRYKAVLSDLELELPAEGLRCTICPSVDLSRGIWAASGINAAGVGMTATETITTNPRVQAADPLLRERDPKAPEKELLHGLGEEDIVILVLPYVRSAREGAERLAALLEQYGTYEANGIAFNDENEAWWLETIGGHHYIARRVPDDAVVINPNQFGMDAFDLEDAFGARKAHFCSPDLREFIAENHLDCCRGGVFDPRALFGSHSAHDHIYNTPRAWYMGRYLTPRSHRWDGPDAEFTPESDDIPWSLVPERKVTVEDLQFLLSSHYQGTPYDPYSNRDTGMRGMYRSIGINRTGVTTICQIRAGLPDAIKDIEWLCFGSTTFSATLPLYAGVSKMPRYLSEVGREVSSENFYWASRLIDALADGSYNASAQHVERYQNAVLCKGRRLILEYDKKMLESGDFSLAEEANEALAEMAKKESADALGKVLHEASVGMKNGFRRADN